jgi:hypothetical protein
VLWGERLWAGIPFIPVVWVLNVSVTVKMFSSTDVIKCFGFIKNGFPCYGQSPPTHNESGIPQERRK